MFVLARIIVPAVLAAAVAGVFGAAAAGPVSSPLAPAHCALYVQGQAVQGQAVQGQAVQGLYVQGTDVREPVVSCGRGAVRAV
ncbi:hypothetical protein [Actinomadura sp. 9N407]|uniref:hypothetical protein n=1 Tax=Actinomadura sp. 9N407 TaxID=3375154 RepID=UPI00378C7257